MKEKKKAFGKKILSLVLTACMFATTLTPTLATIAYAQQMNGTLDASSVSNVDAGEAVKNESPKSDVSSQPQADSSGDESVSVPAAESSSQSTVSSSSVANSEPSSGSTPDVSSSQSQEQEVTSSSSAESSSSSSSSSDASSSSDTSSPASEANSSSNVNTSSSDASIPSAGSNSSSENEEETVQDSSSDVGSMPASDSQSDSGEEKPEQSAEEFVALTVTNPAGEKILAEVGKEVTLSAGVNREDVEVSYQWQRMQLAMPETEQEDVKAVYSYSENAPTWYMFPLDNITEAEALKQNPDAKWNGIEMYLAAVEALDEIGADSSSVSFAWRTPNYVLDGYKITAENVGDTVKLYAEKDGQRYTAVLNAEGKFEFSETEETAPQSENTWIDVEGATEPSYTFTVAEEDYYAQYRLKVTILDEEYLSQCIDILEEQGAELTEEQKAERQSLYSVVIQIESSEKKEEASSPVQTENGLETMVSLFAVNTQPHLSEDGQWICGLNGNYQYITEDTYNRANQWYKEKKISWAQFNYYWTYLNPMGWKGNERANVLDENGFPTGQLRTYNGFNLTDGKLEVASEWYGKTVYFRVAGTNSITKIKIPAYTELFGDGDKYSEAASGSKYKKAITFLNPYTLDTGSMYENFLNFTSSDGWLVEMDASGNLTGNRTDNHIEVYAVDAVSFNADPQRYMVDAEGNYRMDSVGWGVCTREEPDISGKAYWVLKDYIANGYGFLTGHDTMYAYAGAYYDALGKDLDESSIDPNDGTTWYYDINSWAPGTTATDTNGNKSTTRGGHFYMNELMGSNAGNVYSGTVTPKDAPSLILSTGGSHGKYPKTAMYGSESINILQLGYAADLAKTNPRYRTPTNYPFAFAQGQVFKSSFTHTNGQAAFGSVWANYAGENLASQQWGAYEDPLYWAIDGLTGTNNFYLTGDGNYLMNQIGHLPENSATNGESILFANSVMYVSQRKQCEICAANQNGQQTSHFVQRVSAANANTVLTALQNGGNYWYPIDGCYQLTEDITLPEDWTSIKGFKGHWNSDVYEVALNSKGTPLLANDSADGLSGWNLGTDPNKGTVNVFDGNMTRSTGVARVLGDLNDLFGTLDKNYAGYTVKIFGSDNPRYMGSGEVYTCTVNTDSKYVISNLPCVYDTEAKTGVLNVRVYDTAGKEVTEYGSIHVNVSKDFWDNDMTIPLYLGSFAADPIKDVQAYESAQAFFTAVGYSDKELSVARWEYRKPGQETWSTVPSNWDVKITNTQNMDGDTRIVESTLMLRNVNPSWNGYEFRAVYSSSAHGEWNTYGYYSQGAKVSCDPFDGGIYKEIARAGEMGRLSVKLWPTYTEQSEDKEVYEGESATFSSKGYALANNNKVQAVWQYSTKGFDVTTGQEKLEWHDVEGSNEFGGLQSISTQCAEKPELDHNIPYLLSKTTAKTDMDLFKTNAKFYEVTTSLTVRKVDIEQDEMHFRVKYTATTSFGTKYEWYSNIADNFDGRWVNQDGTICNDVQSFPVVQQKHGNVLYVEPPKLEVVTTPSSNFALGNQTVDTLTPDEYGQMLTLPAGDYSDHVSGRVAYQAIIYYLPQSQKPTPEWQYMTFSDRTVRPWNQSVARSVTGSSKIQVSVSNEDLGQIQTGEYKGYNAIRSTMTITTPPLSMYDSETMTKYYFRCLGSTEYETVRSQKGLKKVDRWGGLAMDYSIALQHNGVLTYGQKNVINQKTVTDIDGIVEATKNQSKSTWSYPNLKIEIPSGRTINTAIVYFEGNHNANDKIIVNTAYINARGIIVSEQANDKLVLVSETKNKVPVSVWDDVLRNAVSFETYDKADYTSGVQGGVKVSWFVDENRYAGLTIDPDTGNAYKIVKSEKALSWDAAKQAAEKYNSDYGLNGKLVSISNQKENEIVKGLTGQNEAWIGGYNANGWKWVDGSAFSYQAWKAGADTSKKYLYMTSGGWDSSNGTETISNSYSFQNILYNKVYSAILPTASSWINTQYAKAPSRVMSALHTDPDTSNFQNWRYSADLYGNYQLDNALFTVRIPGDFLPIVNGMVPVYYSDPIQFNKDHYYYVQIVADSFGDQNGQMAGGIMADNGWVPGSTWLQSFSTSSTNGGGIYQQIQQVITGFSGQGVLNFWHTRKSIDPGNPLWNANAQIYQYAIFDLTAAFGSNEEMERVLTSLGYKMDANGISNFMSKEVNSQGTEIRNDAYETGHPSQPANPYKGVRNSATVTIYSKITKDIYYYVAEYNIAALSMRTTNHSAIDDDVIGTGVKANLDNKSLTVYIEGNSKIYDGEPIEPKSFMVTGTVGANSDLVQIQYSAPIENNFADYTGKTVSGSDWRDTEAINATRYHAVVTLTDEARKAGWTLDLENSQLECDLIIAQRPVNVYSYHNDKTYDGISSGLIRNIQQEALAENSGVIAGDTVKLNTTLIAGSYIDDGDITIHNSKTNNNGEEYEMRRNDQLSKLYIVHNNTSDPHYNYVLGTETYTGHINPKGLYVHSLYLEDKDNPRNVKTYDGNNAATIKDILIDGIVTGDKIGLKQTTMTGTYATANAGEKLDSNGQALPDRLTKLDENVITATKKAELTGNNFGDYFIEREEYSGAICRALLEVTVSNHRYVYGSEGPGYPTYDDVYRPNTLSDSWMRVDGLQGNDILDLDKNFTLAAKDKDGTQIEFTDRTPVGTYPVVPEGLTETNYPVLGNYLVSITSGKVEVYPREIVITTADTDWYVKDEGIPQTHAIFEMANDDGETYKEIGNDADNEYADMKLIGKDTIANTILVGDVAPTKEAETSAKESGTGDTRKTVFQNGSNLPYTTPWYVGAPAVFLDIESDTTVYPCEWCEKYHGFEMGTDHWRIGGYNLTINQDAESGNTLDVVEVENPLGEMVKNYVIRYVDGLLRVHPELRFQLKATVPLEVCMYGYAGDGEIVEPENYGITNYSNGAIQITDIEVKDDGWNIVDKAPTELLRGEMTMKMNDTQLVVGHNKPRNPNQWVIKADESEDDSGVQMLIPMTCYIAGGNVNERQETYITHVTYTIAEYGVTVPEVDGVELPDFIHGKPVTVDKND